MKWTLLVFSLVAALPEIVHADDLARRWGVETLSQIDADLWNRDRALYADSAAVGQDPREAQPAFMWGCGVQLSALAGAARVDRRRYGPELKRFAEGLKAYWVVHGGLWGFDVLPAPKPVDRYYDDNAWMVLAFIEASEAARSRDYLQRAEEAFRFVLSGEDERLGGGIYWHEQSRSSKNTCVNAPAIVGALRLYQRTHKADYLETARRIYAWANAHLQDSDGLYWDNISLAGSVEKTKWSYNTGLMLRANCLLYEITRRGPYLDEAERIAEGAAARWVDQATGGIRDGGAFAHLLLEGFLSLYDIDHDRRWLGIARRAASFVHDRVRDANGHHGSNWDTPVEKPLAKAKLLDEASAARLYWMVARYRAD